MYGIFFCLIPWCCFASNLFVMNAQQNQRILQVECISSNQLLNAVSDLMDEKLAKMQSSQTPPEDSSFITRQDVADLFRISLPTVHAWMNAGILTPYKIGNKTRFILREVKAAAVHMGSKREVSHV